jgi:hypothetical protein
MAVINIRDEVEALYDRYIQHGTPEYLTYWHATPEIFRAIREEFMHTYPRLVASLIYDGGTPDKAVVTIVPKPGYRAVGLRISSETPDEPFTESQFFHMNGGLAKLIKNVEIAVSSALNQNVDKVILRRAINSAMGVLLKSLERLDE